MVQEHKSTRRKAHTYHNATHGAASCIICCIPGTLFGINYHGARAQEYKAQGAHVPQHYAWRSFLHNMFTRYIIHYQVFVVHLLLVRPHPASYYMLDSRIPHVKHNEQTRYSKEASAPCTCICMTVPGYWAQSTKNIKCQPISCYRWPTGCSKHKNIRADPVYCCYLLLRCSYYCWFSETTARGIAESKGLPPMDVCLSAGLCGV